MGGTLLGNKWFFLDVICSGYRKGSNMGSCGRLTANVLDYVRR